MHIFPQSPSSMRYSLYQPMEGWRLRQPAGSGARTRRALPKNQMLHRLELSRPTFRWWVIIILIITLLSLVSFGHSIFTHPNINMYSDICVSKNVSVNYDKRLDLPFSPVGLMVPPFTFRFLSNPSVLLTNISLVVSSTSGVRGALLWTGVAYMAATSTVVPSRLIRGLSKVSLYSGLHIIEPGKNFFH